MYAVYIICLSAAVDHPVNQIKQQQQLLLLLLRLVDVSVSAICPEIARRNLATTSFTFHQMIGHRQIT